MSGTRDDEKWTFDLVEDTGPPEPLSVDPLRRADVEAVKRADAMPYAGLRCPDCGYDLTGARRGVCPECGLKLTNSALRRARDKQNRRASDSPLFEPLLWLAGGVVLGCGVYGISTAVQFAAAAGAPGGGGNPVVGGLIGGLIGVLAFAVYVTVTVLVGWGVFFAASAMWIGWAQTIPVTIVQLAGAYTAATAMSGAFDLFLPGPLAWLISVGCLIGLLCRLLDLETRDAIVVAFVTWAIKFVIALAVMGGILAAATG